MAYVVQYLKNGGDGAFASNIPTTHTLSSESQPHHRNVYFYYCRDNRNAEQALNAFRVLLSQLLKDHEDLCLHFNSRVQEQEKQGHNPTSNPSRLKDLLIDLVAKLQQPTFFIIDALDECFPSDRGDLLDFLEKVCNQTTSTPTRVLTSARASQSDSDLSERLFPTKAVPICSWKLTLPQRDHDIAEFLVNHHMRYVSVSEDVRRLLVEKLTSGMQGCAIWARMTLEYLVIRARRTSVDSIQSYLEKKAPPKPLAELYIEVFENMTRDDDKCKWLLARCLALIAGAGRPLGFDELLYALSVYTPPSEGGVSRAVKDLAELQKNLCEEVDEGCVRQLLRPFADLEPKVGFVHQSLKETVLKFPALTEAARSTIGGGIGIEGVMFKTCSDYLMLDDFNWTEMIPDDKGVRGKISQAHQKMLEVHEDILEANHPMP